MAKHGCDCAKPGRGAATLNAARPRVVNTAGDDLGPFNWETAVGSDIARGTPPAVALQRGQVLKSIVLASGEIAISTDAIRYVMEGTRHLDAGDQPSEPELAKFSAYFKRTAKPRIGVTPAEGANFGLGPRESPLAAPYEGLVVTSFGRAEGEPGPLGARSLKRHANDAFPSMLNAALLLNLRQGYGDPFPAFRLGKGDGMLWGEPDADGKVDEEDIDLPGAPDEGDVYVRIAPDRPRHNGCDPAGTMVCKNRGTVFQPIRTEPPLNARIEFGQPQVTMVSTHTVKVVITLTLVKTVEVYQKMYRRIDCCCEWTFFTLDCWTELGYIGDTPKDVIEERSILPPMEHVTRDWGEWTLELFTDLIKKAADSAAGAAGGAVAGPIGGLVGDALKDAAGPLVDEAKRKAADALGGLGIGAGSTPAPAPTPGTGGGSSGGTPPP